MNYFTLDEKGNPVREPNEHKWEEWFNTTNRSVARDVIGISQISTLFIGMGLGDESTALWQTQVLDGPLDGHAEEVGGTKAQALEMHERVVKRIKEIQATES